MPRALTHYARDLVAAKLDSGMSLAAIHNDTNVSSRQIRRIRHNIQTWGSIVPPSLVKRGRPKSLTLTMEDALAEYLDQRPTAYQNEMVRFLWDEFNVNISIPSLSRTLKRIELTRKKLQEKTAQRNETPNYVSNPDLLIIFVD